MKKFIVRRTYSVVNGIERAKTTYVRSPLNPLGYEAETSDLNNAYVFSLSDKIAYPEIVYLDSPDIVNRRVVNYQNRLGKQSYVQELMEIKYIILNLLPCR